MNYGKVIYYRVDFMCYVGRQAMKIYEYLIMTEYIGRDGIANIYTQHCGWLKKRGYINIYYINRLYLYLPAA